MNIFSATVDTRTQNGLIATITQYDHATLELQILSGGQVGGVGNPEFELLNAVKSDESVYEVEQEKFTI